MNRLACLFVFCVFAMTGCAEPRSFVIHRPEDKRVDTAVTAMWSHEVHGVARDGDWILTRSYYALGDAISKLTPGEDLSHASIYDATRDTVIEAVGSGVREIPLAELVQRNHYVIVVRPTGMSAEAQSAALTRARAQIGKPFDKAGMFGFEDPEKFYCSELVWWASQTEARSGEHERVITPSDLMKYGSVIYWSGKRDDAQVMELATERTPRTAVAKVTASR
jgi:hypothetical protein